MEDRAIKGAGRMAHAYIISSSAPEEGLRRACQMAAAAICERGGAEACGQCRHCRKALAGVHPDVALIGRPGDKREIGVEQIRQLTGDAIVLPNEARRKVYIIREADSMNLPAQNAALKLLEEPPGGAMFLLCAANPDKLLPTVRSRCVELSLNGPDAEADEDSQRLAGEYLKTVAHRDAARLCLWCGKNEGMDQAAATAFLQCARERVADMLCGRKPALGLSREELAALSALTGRCLQYLRVNVGVKHIFGLLAVDSISGS